MSDNKPPLLLFTTKWIDNDKYLFSKNNCNLIQLNQNNSLFKHLKNNIEVGNKIKGLLEKNETDFINFVIENDNDLQNDTDKNFAKNTFLGEVINNNEYQRENYQTYSNLNKVYANNSKLSTLTDVKTLLELVQTNSLNFRNIYDSNKNFKSRQYIWKINNEEIYAYRCIDTSFPNEVFKHHKNPKKYFIQAVLEDIASYNKINLETLFNNYNVYLILHRDDIDFPEITKQLDQEEIKNFLITNNTNLSEKYKYGKDKTFVFQHDYGIFPNILSEKLSIDYTAQNIATEIDNFFKNRVEFKSKEDEAFKDLDIKGIKTKISDITREKNANYKLY